MWRTRDTQCHHSGHLASINILQDIETTIENLGLSFERMKELPNIDKRLSVLAILPTVDGSRSVVRVIRNSTTG